tara:strand:- start:63 stop:851 length:789 start_codon:yes stop_codon:yes gene_type:complete
MKINYSARQLIRSSSKGFLSTQFNPNSFKEKKINLKQDFPYSTFTLTAYDYDLCPIILLSNLSEHTTNIKNNNLVSLMVCEEQKLYTLFPEFKNKNFEYEDPMSRPRITLIGRLKITNDDNHKKRFLMRHPAAELYANFSDMNFYKLNIIGAHLIGGFASVKWFNKDQLVLSKFLNFKNFEEGVITHMNECHQNSIDLYISKLIKPINSRSSKGWKIVGIDPEGFDLRKKHDLVRYFFKKEIQDAKRLRGIFVGLHKEATKI